MSLAEGGREILCDGAGCPARAWHPVALRAKLARPDTATAEGWLFVEGTEGWRHFCPGCSRRYLSELMGPDPARAALHVAPARP